MLYTGCSLQFLLTKTYYFVDCLVPCSGQSLPFHHWFFCLQVSDDDSYISDVSDTISMDTCSNEGGSERHNSGTWCSSRLCVCACASENSREKDRRCKQTLFFHRGSSMSVRSSVTKPMCIFQKVSNELWTCGIRENTCFLRQCVQHDGRQLVYKLSVIFHQRVCDKASVNRHHWLSAADCVCFRFSLDKPLPPGYTKQKK